MAPGATEFMDAWLPFLGTPGKVTSLLGKVGSRVAMGVLAEGGQEGLQQFLQNLIEKGIYNPKKNVLDEVAYNALIGGIVGGGVSGVFGGHGHEAPSAPATEADLKKTQATITGGNDSGDQLALNLGEPNIQTARLNIKGNTATDAPAVESPTPPVTPPVTPDQPVGYRPGEPIPGPNGGLPADSVAPGNAPQAVGEQTDIDGGVPIPGPEINPLTGAPKYPSLQENNPPGGVPQVFAGQRNIPQTNIGLGGAPGLAANENPDAQRAMRIQRDAASTAEHVRLVGDYTSTELQISNHGPD